MSPPRVRVFLYVSGFDAPHASIDEALGLRATKTWTKGQPRGPKFVHELNRSRFDSPLSDEVDPEKHLEAMLSSVSVASVSTLRTREPALTLTFGIVIEMADQTPPFHLSPKLVADLAAIRAELDVDLSVVDQDELEQTTDLEKWQAARVHEPCRKRGTHESA